jgi:hypothetical protein
MEYKKIKIDVFLRYVTYLQKELFCNNSCLHIKMLQICGVHIVRYAEKMFRLELRIMELYLQRELEICDIVLWET